MPQSWTVLRESPRRELVLACDFSTTARRIATFSELVALMDSEVTVWETAPAPAEQATALDGAVQVERWLAAVRASDRPVRAVLGFCSGGVYAAALAARISAWQPTRLILLDPEPVDARMLLEFHDDVVSRFGALGPSSTEVDAALARGREAAAALALPALAERLGTLCARFVEPVCAGIGIGTARCAEYVGLAVSYLHWLGAAASLDVAQQWAHAVALTCATEGSGLRRVPEHERDALVAHAVHLGVSHEDLMRSPETARITDELVGREETGWPRTW